MTESETFMITHTTGARERPSIEVAEALAFRNACLPYHHPVPSADLLATFDSSAT